MTDHKGEQVYDSPTGWVNEHVRRYVDTAGSQGRVRAGMDNLLITTRGRRSGKLRRTALVYRLDDDRYILVASNAGASSHPAWYLNLLANPQVLLQIGAEQFTAQARTATDEEKARLWGPWVSALPQYEQYQAKTSRDIPMVIVERI